MKFHTRHLNFFVGSFLLLALAAPITYASISTPTVCEGQAGKAFGLCRAAVASGCATSTTELKNQGVQTTASGISNSDSRFCKRLSSKFTKLTGVEPVWIIPSKVKH